VDVEQGRKRGEEGSFIAIDFVSVFFCVFCAFVYLFVCLSDSLVGKGTGWDIQLLTFDSEFCT